MAAEEARAQMRQLLADKGRARLSRWSRLRGDAAAPNPAYDPAVTVAQIAALLPASGDEGHDDEGAA